MVTSKPFVARGPRAVQVLKMAHHRRPIDSAIRLVPARCSLKRRTRRYALLSASQRYMRCPVVDQCASVDGRYRFPFIVTNVPSSFDRNAAQFLHHVIGLEKTRACIYQCARGHENCAICEDKTKPCRREDTESIFVFFRRLVVTVRLNVPRVCVIQKKTCDSILNVSWRVGRSAQWLFNTVDVNFRM
jgi:hypothetical protein